MVNQYGRSHWKSVSKSCPCPQESVYQNVRIADHKEPRYNEVVVDFVDRVHGTGFQEIRPWRPLSAIPVEIVDVVSGTDSYIPLQ